MRTRLWIIGGVLAVVLVGTLVVWQVTLRDTATPLLGSDVVAEIGGSPSAPSTQRPPGDTSRPSATPQAGTGSVGGDAFVVGSAPGDPGLYTYATTGFEEIDALGGARRAFLTLQPGGCGTIARWTALEERWDEHELCRSPGGFDAAAYNSFHEWFGQSDLQEFSCGPRGVPAIPLEAGSWSYECANDARTEVFEVEALTDQAWTVGGDAVDAVLVRIRSTLSGESTGSSKSETWYLPGTSLILFRNSFRTSVNESPIGDVTYTEDYQMNLVSLTPAGRPND